MPKNKTNILYLSRVQTCVFELGAKMLAVDGQVDMIQIYRPGHTDIMVQRNRFKKVIQCSRFKKGIMNTTTIYAYFFVISFDPDYQRYFTKIMD